MPTPELPNVWVVIPNDLPQAIGLSLDTYLNIKSVPDATLSSQFRSVHEYTPATEAKILRAALAQAEQDLRALRTAVAEVQERLMSRALDADNHFEAGYFSSVAHDLEQALNPEAKGGA